MEMNISGYIRFDLDKLGASTSRGTTSNNQGFDMNYASFTLSPENGNYSLPDPIKPVTGHFQTCQSAPLEMDSCVGIFGSSFHSTIEAQPSSTNLTLGSPGFDCFEKNFSSSTATDSNHNFEPLEGLLSPIESNPAIDYAPSTSHEIPGSRHSNCMKKKTSKPKSEGLVAKRNARERRRVQAVNGAFSKLRKHIPYENRNKRLSKVKTLRIAIDYIHNLQNLLENRNFGSYRPSSMITAAATTSVMSGGHAV